jgi:hypothetical protein
MQSVEDITVKFENPRHVIDISSQPQMVRKDVNLSQNSYPPHRPQFLQPNLNISDASLGIDLLINPKKRTDAMSSASSSSGDADDRGRYYDNSSGSGSGSDASGSDGSGSVSGSGTDTSSSASDSGSDHSGGNPYFNRQVMSEEEVINQKKEILYQFDRLERKGTRLARKFTLASSLDEMKAELDKVVREKQVDASVKFQRRILVTAVTGMEMLNSRFDPVGAKLDGWSESINDGIDEYDEVFEELHEKYKGKAKMAPELKLLMMLGGSAFMFHLTNSMFKSSAMPGLDQVLKQNPDLAKQFASATANTMHQTGADPMGIGKLFTGMFGGQQSAPSSMPQQAPPMPSNPMGQPMSSNMGGMRPPPAARPTMKGPSLDNILADLENGGDRLETMSTLTESEISEIPDDGSLNGLLINKSKKGRRTLNF